jgi:hypothetical protein
MALKIHELKMKTGKGHPMLEQLEQYEYKEFDVNKQLDPHVERTWMKWFRDSDGQKLYAIHVNQYKRMPDNELVYEAKAQLNCCPHETPMTFNVNVLAGADLRDIQNLVGAIYNVAECTPYN